MKKIIYGIFLFSSFSAYSAQVKSVSFNVNYFEKSKNIKKDYVFDNLDELDMASKISEIELEIVDENIE